MSDIDTSKTYLCYFCEEVIEYRSLTPEEKAVLANEGRGLPLVWRHKETGAVSCKCEATPSNIEVEQEAYYGAQTASGDRLTGAP